ncbi:MAG: flagellar basal body P-ring formation chaperone FlgA [Parvibaculum sp.]|nr:flagellar basal body P-ring formation chaperone FlgA [Parvibaculum sp.]
MRLRSNLKALALVPALLLAGTFGASAAELNTNASVERDVVTLGDLFDDAGNAADIIVAPAPAPGTQINISVSKISLLARRNGLAWRNTTGLTHVTVSRAGVAVPEADVSAAIISAIKENTPALLPTTAMQVDFTGGSSGVQVGEQDVPNLKIEQISFNARSGSFDAIVRAPADNANAPLRRVVGRAYAVAEVPVLMHDVAPGTVVSAADIQWIKLPATRVSNNIVTTTTNLIGMSPRYPVRAGEPVRISDMQMPVAIVKGAVVDMNYKAGTLVLLARGRALQSGAIGDTIDILNPRSNRTVQGVIEGPNVVRIDNLTAPRVQAETVPQNTDLKS